MRDAHLISDARQGSPSGRRRSRERGLPAPQAANIRAPVGGWLRQRAAQARRTALHLRMPCGHIFHLALVVPAACGVDTITKH